MNGAKRHHRTLVGVILTLAVVVSFGAALALWVNRQALNTDAWTNTSGRLLENKNVQKALSVFMVEQLFDNVDVAGQLQTVLPPQAAALAGPAAAGLRELAGRLAPQLLASPTVQNAWRLANRTAHQELLKVINGGSSTISTANGEVVLNLRPLIDRLAAALGVEKQVQAARNQLQGTSGANARNAIQQRLNVTLPATSGRVVLMRSDQLKTVQSVAHAIRPLAVVLTALMVILFALAIWLAEGWRRVALRRVGWCFIGVGLTVLIVRRVLGDRVVDALVSSETVRPAAHSAFTIGTTLLYDIGIAAFAYGVAFVVGAWLAGKTRPAVSLRRVLAPALRYHLASVYGVVALLYLLVIAWGPTAALRKPAGIILFAGLIILGVEVLRRQVARENPDVQRGGAGARMRAWLSGTRDRVSTRRKAGTATPEELTAEAATLRLAELEQLSSLHDRGVLTDAEFDTQKHLLLSG